MINQKQNIFKSPKSTEQNKKVVALGGDGIGPIVVDATVHILENMNIDGLILKKMPCGKSAIETHGNAFPEETKDEINNSDAALFGATHRSAIQVLAYLRWGLGNYANIRPIISFEGMHSVMKPEYIRNVNYAFVRESTEGMYAATGKEGKLKKLIKKGLIYKPDQEKWGEKAIYAMRIVSPQGTDRIGRAACQYCMKRKKEGIGRGLLEIVCKPNVLRSQDGMFIKRIKKIAKKEFPEIKVETYIVDDFASRLIRFPSYHDTIVIPNMMGDILSDEAAQIVGGLGIAGSGVYGGKIPYFEPTHGAAPDIAGQKIANPIATCISAAMMLDYLHFEKEADNLLIAIKKSLQKGVQIDKYWHDLPKDAVPPKYREDKKFGKTFDVANSIIDEYSKLIK